jgi:acyl-CoA:acyl-CoA alkyltransferase
MKFSRVGLSAFGVGIPEQILTSREIETKLAPALTGCDKKFSHEGWFEALTGVAERRLWEKNTTPSDAAVLAATDLFASNESIDRSEIGAVLFCGVSRDFSEPSTATIAHAKLGLQDTCLSFDLSNACLGALNGIVTAANMIELGQIRSALVLSSEITGPLYTAILKLISDAKSDSLEVLQEQLAGLTLGSGAVAILLQHLDDVPVAHRLVGGAHRSTSSAWPLCKGNADPESSWMQTDSSTLLAAGTQNSLNAWEPFLNTVGWRREEIDLIAPHQVSRPLAEMTSGKLGYAQSKTAYTYSWLGNTASAAVPLTLALETRKPNRIRAGDKVALLGTGSGVNSLFLGLEW